MAKHPEKLSEWIHNLAFRSGVFKYVDTIRDKKGKLRCWASHDKLAKEQRRIDWGIQNEKQKQV